MAIIISTTFWGPLFGFMYTHYGCCQLNIVYLSPHVVKLNSRPHIQLAKAIFRAEKEAEILVCVMVGFPLQLILLSVVVGIPNLLKYSSLMDFQ